MLRVLDFLKNQSTIILILDWVLVPHQHWSYNSLVNIFKVCGFELVKNNRYYDENDIVLIFKNSRKFNQIYKFDDYLKVINFIKRWKNESKIINFLSRNFMQ